MDLDRRNFLSSFGIIAYAIGMGGFNTLKTFLKGSKETLIPAHKKNPFLRDGKNLISVVHGKDIKRVVKESIDAIGGLKKIDIRDKTVLVKPNIVGGRRNPTTTNPEVVRAMISILYEEGASKVFVGDMSALIRRGTERNMEKTGIKKAADEAGAEVLYFEDYEWIKIKLDKGKYIKEVDVSEWIYKVDRIINLPVIKTHAYATYSICLKNFVGATHFKQRPYFVDKSHWEEIVTEINMAYTPDLNIADGTKVMISGGPWKGKEKQPNLIIASGDRIAADVVGLGVITALGGDIPGGAWNQKQIRRAVEMGMGAGNRDEIELVTASLDDSREFEKLIEKIKENIT
jgi:uncharacterized protein (DUF362 family)